MNAHQLANLRKAARADLAWLNDAATWHAGIEAIAKAAQRPGETPEAAYARVTVEDADARAMLSMHAQASSQAQAARTGRPREYDPGVIKRGQIEQALSDAAMRVAKAQGVSYEMGFREVLNTDAGRDLYAALRAMEPESAE